jgi:glycosylphosphatidylinositol phospholipase D
VTWGYTDYGLGDVPPPNIGFVALASGFSGVHAAVRGSSCPADLDGDGSVGVDDFLSLLAAWGSNPGHPADFDGDGSVDIDDFLALLTAWGPCP